MHGGRRSSHRKKSLFYSDFMSIYFMSLYSEVYSIVSIVTLYSEVYSIETLYSEVYSIVTLYSDL